jgi:hypothetical protein
VDKPGICFLKKKKNHCIKVPYWEGVNLTEVRYMHVYTYIMGSASVQRDFPFYN